MNTSVTLAADIDYLRNQVKKFKIQSRRDLKKAIKLKFNSLSDAAKQMNVNYQTLSDTIHGRRYHHYIISILQREFNLTDQQVLEFWPLLKRWPKEID